LNRIELLSGAAASASALSYYCLLCCWLSIL